MQITFKLFAMLADHLPAQLDGHTREGNALRLDVPEGTTVQQVIDRYVTPTVGQPVKLELVGEIPLDSNVRDAVLKRELLMDKQPGSPAGIGMSALGLKLRGVV